MCSYYLYHESFLSLALPPVLLAGTDAQKALVCRDVITGRKNISLAISEPGADGQVGVDRDGERIRGLTHHREEAVDVGRDDVRHQHDLEDASACVGQLRDHRATPADIEQVLLGGEAIQCK